MIAHRLPGHTRRIVAVSLLLAAGACVHSHAAVKGTVLDSITRRALVDAIVAVDGTRRKSADSLGRYAVFRLRPGAHTVAASTSGRYGAITHLALQNFDTVEHDFLLAREPQSGIFPVHGEVWLGCAGALHADTCDHGRRLETPLRGFTSADTWVFNNTAELDHFWRAHMPASARIELPVINWAVERVFAATTGGRSGCGNAHVINRFEHREDSTFVVLGPDSLPYGPYPDQCAAFRDDADVIVGPRTVGPLSFVWTHPGHPRLPYLSTRSGLL